MTFKFVCALAGILAVILFGAEPLQAEPMTCSGEQKVCVANCTRSPKGVVATCIGNCSARQSMCKQTGCWNNGTNRYCGLARQ